MFKWIWATDVELASLAKAPVELQVQKREVPEELPLPTIDQEELYGELPLCSHSIAIVDFEEIRKLIYAELLGRARQSYTLILNPRIGVERSNEIYARLTLYGTIILKGPQEEEKPAIKDMESLLDNRVDFMDANNPKRQLDLESLKALIRK